MAAPSAPAPALLYCSFCLLSAEQVGKLIAGPGVYICDHCVELCNGILRDERVPPFGNWEALADEELLALLVPAAAARDAEQRLAEPVRILRGRGVTWARIGQALGVSRQAAWERFSGEE